MKRGLLVAGLCALVVSGLAQAEDGYDLWLRYHPLEKAALAHYRPLATSVVVPGQSPTANAARDEIVRGLSGLLGRPEKVDTAFQRPQQAASRQSFDLMPRQYQTGQHGNTYDTCKHHGAVQADMPGFMRDQCTCSIPVGMRPL